MSNSITKKLTSVLLSATTVVWLTGSSLLAPVAYAQSTDLQAQINALLAQIAALQSQLASGSSSSAPSYNYTRNLTVGSRGADVTALQNFLIGKGFLKIASATDYFGSLTKAALAAYQASVGISPAVGYFGSITRAKVASVGAAPAPSPAPEPTPAPTPIPTPAPAPKPSIKTGTGTATPNRYISFGTGSFLYAGVSPRDRRAFLYPGDPADTVANVNPITGYSNCEDINELNYIGIKNICEFTDPAKYTFTPHEKPIRFYDRSASNPNAPGAVCYKDILLFKQGGMYGGFDPETMDPDGTLHYRYWYDESGGTNFASLCSSSSAPNATASLLESLKSTLEKLRSLVK